MLIESLQISNPYPMYDNWRQNSSVYRNENGSWYLTRYDDVKLLLSDRRFARRPPENFGFVDQKKDHTALDKVISTWLLFNDPPEHTKLRECLGSLFDSRFIKETKTLIESVADSLLVPLLQSPTIDFMQAFACPLPVNVINKLLGTTLGEDLDIATVRKWSLAIVNAMDRGLPEDFRAITAEVLAMQEYFRVLLLKRELKPQNDWISQLLSLRQQYDLSMDEIISTCIFLFLSGHETVQLTLGLLIMTLLKNPEQLKLLQGDPKLIPSAIEEILRFESPFNKASRWTQEAIQMQDVLIPENQLVVGLINAANRDPARFINPHQFDITRSNNRHLAFGAGIHNCLGALLARIELQTALAKLLPYLHHFTLLEDEIVWVPNTSFRYLSRLMLKVAK